MEDYFEFDSREVLEELVEQWRECENDRGILKRCCEAYQYIVEKQAEELKEAQAEAEKWKGLFGEAVRTQERLAENCEKLVEKLAMCKTKGGCSNE